MYKIILVFFLFCTTGAMSQGRISLSQKHVNKINHEENTRKKLALYRKYAVRDSIKYVKNCNRYLKLYSDSLLEAVAMREEALNKKGAKVKDGINSKIYLLIYRPWAKKEARRYVRMIDESGFKPSASFRLIVSSYLKSFFLRATQNDSLIYSLEKHQYVRDVPKQLKSKIKIYGRSFEKNIQSDKAFPSLISKRNRYSKRLEKYKEYRMIRPNTESGHAFAKKYADKYAGKYASQINDFVPVNKVRDQFTQTDKMRDQVTDYKSQLRQVQDSTHIKNEAKKKAEELAAQYIADHPEVMQAMQRKMSLLMKKYSVVPNSNDLSTATKLNSLKRKAFFERLQIATNFQVTSIKPISVDFAPQVGYRFNKKFSVGIGGLYRKTFKDSLSVVSADAIGYKGFAAYEVLNKIFIHGEFGNNSSKVSEQASHRIWERTLLLGVGRKLLIHPKIEMILMAGYNFGYQRGDTIYPKPWIIRVGFQTSNLAFLNKRKLQANNLKGRF